jgi:hypothetical protein
VQASGAPRLSRKVVAPRSASHATRLARRQRVLHRLPVRKRLHHDRAAVHVLRAQQRQRALQTRGSACHWRLRARACAIATSRPLSSHFNVSRYASSAASSLGAAAEAETRRGSECSRVLLATGATCAAAAGVATRGVHAGMSAPRRQSAHADGGCGAARRLALRAAACRDGSRALLAAGCTHADMATDGAHAGGAMPRQQRACVA